MPARDLSRRAGGGMLLPLAAAAVLAACGGSSLSASTSCQEFIDASRSAQDRAVTKLAEEMNAPAATTPLGRPNIDQLCASAPQKTLGEAIDAMNGGSTTAGTTPTPEATEDPVETSPPEETSEVAEEPTPEPEAGLLALGRVYDWETSANDQASASVQVALGTVARASDPAALGDFAQYLDICDVDPERDAAIPVRLTIANTTPDFSADYDVNMSLAQGKTMSFSVASRFSDGGDCTEPYSGSPPGVSFSDVAPDASATHNWLVIVTGYYSPKHPDGNAKELARSGANLLISTKDGILGAGCGRAATSGLSFALYDPDAPADGEAYDTTC